VLPRPPAFHVLVKPTGALCNLDCSYCFFLSKERCSIRGVVSGWRMNCSKPIFAS
jgi:sulfatase maturation enzyme AslB (radical SAM superfamily)